MLELIEAISESLELILVLLVLILDSTSVKSPTARVPETVASVKVVAPVTPSVPAIAVLPVEAATVNLLVLISKSPSMPVAPVTSSVELSVAAPLTLKASDKSCCSGCYSTLGCCQNR